MSLVTGAHRGIGEQENGNGWSRPISHFPNEAKMRSFNPPVFMKGAIGGNKRGRSYPWQLDYALSGCSISSIKIPMEVIARFP
jgi:hypothetical protein